MDEAYLVYLSFIFLFYFYLFYFLSSIDEINLFKQAFCFDIVLNISSSVFFLALLFGVISLYIIICTTERR